MSTDTNQPSDPFDVEVFLRQMRTRRDQAARDERHSSEVMDASLRRDSRKLTQKIKRETHETRQSLIWFLSIVTLFWLIFTAFVVSLLGFQCTCFTLSDSVAIAFLTTSLGNVLALLIIGLKFYFAPFEQEKNKK